MARLAQARGVLSKGANAGLQKAFGKPGTVDPAAAIASTAKDSADAYAALHQKPVDPIAVAKPISAAMPKPNSSEDTGMSPAFRNQVGDIQTALENHYYQGTQPSLGDVNSWKRQINEATVTSVDGKIAGQMNAGLDGVMDTVAPGLNAAAQAAAQKNIMAENLAEWQRKAEAGAPLGQAPLTEAENWFQGKPGYNDLVNLYQKSQNQFDPSYALGHMAAGALGDIGLSMLGPIGHFGGEMLGYMGVKPAIKGMFKGAKQNATVKNVQQLYPQFTGMQPTGAKQAPQVGDMIKNLMLGSAY